MKVSFNLLSSGKVKDIRLLESSGIDVLDIEAMDAVRRAGPFLPFPGDFTINELRFEISMVFRTVPDTR